MKGPKNTVEVTNLSVSFGQTQVLENLAFAAPSGAFISIVGKSGSGKTTFLHALAGFLNCSGSIRRPEKIGVVFQNHSVYPWLTVAENLALAAWDLPPVERQVRVTEALDAIRLLDKADAYPAELSGGQVQRVALARALVPRPDLVLLDEPLGQLDIFTRERMQHWLQALWMKSGATFVLVTHSVEEAIFLSDSIYVLRNGTLSPPWKAEPEWAPRERPRWEYPRLIGKIAELKLHFMQRFFVDDEEADFDSDAVDTDNQSPKPAPGIPVQDVTPDLNINR